MSGRPLIGITIYPPNAGGRFELPEPYVACVRRAGGEPVLLAPGTADVPGLLSRLDGLVLAGGGDIDPALHAGGEHETVYAIDPVRDRDELAMVHTVLERALPTLAICRGSQVVNVALGGTLHLHLPDDVGTDVVHRDEPDVVRGIPAPVPHDVQVEPGSLIGKLMTAVATDGSGADTVTPMSWHHQAVDRLGEGLRAVAWAPDGTIEATEHESHPWLAIVQWHPELTAASDPTQQALFDGLVTAAS